LEENKLQIQINQLFLLLFFSIALPSTVFSDNVIVVTENYPPYSYEQEGKITGTSTDIVKCIMDESGLEYKIEVLPWARAYEMALNRDDVLIYNIMRTPERETLFNWIALLGEAKFYLMGRSEENYEASLPQLIAKGYNATCVINDAACEWLRNAGFDKNHIEIVPDRMQSSEFKMVLFKRADFFVADPISLGYRLQQVNIPEQKFQKVLLIHEGQSFYLAAGKRLKPEILERIEKARNRLKAKGFCLNISDSIQ
jgi:polar amino acid transport system substrate-binding protein